MQVKGKTVVELHECGQPAADADAQPERVLGSAAANLAHLC